MHLFYNTIHTINSNDYTTAQIQVWAKTPNLCWEKWNSRFSDAYSVLAFDTDVLTGFGCLNGDYLDMLYVHHSYQGQGIGSSIVVNLLHYAREKGIENITTHASITAEPFFRSFGFIDICENKVEKEGVLLTNTLMQKSMSCLHVQVKNTEASEENYA